MDKKDISDREKQKILYLNKLQELFDRTIQEERQKGEGVCKHTQAMLYKCFEENIKDTTFQTVNLSHYTSGKKIGFFDEISFFFSYKISNCKEEEFGIVWFCKEEIENYAKSYKLAKFPVFGGIEAMSCFVKVFEFKPNKI